jgi:hypothetical protein
MEGFPGGLENGRAIGEMSERKARRLSGKFGEGGHVDRFRPDRDGHDRQLSGSQFSVSSVVDRLVLLAWPSMLFHSLLALCPVIEFRSVSQGFLIGRAQRI